MPGERLENSLALHLVFCQVVQDVYNNGCIRINKEDRIKMRGMLGVFKVSSILFTTLSSSLRRGLFCVSLYYNKKPSYTFFFGIIIHHLVCTAKEVKIGQQIND